MQNFGQHSSRYSRAHYQASSSSMPPKKRQRLSPPEESATSAAATPRDAPPSKQGLSGAPSPEVLVDDPWTDEQNTALMKGLIKWKPVGMHKHFRMLSLANYLHTHGHEAEHTRPPGIWTKLETLYNMKTLDEREDSYGDSLLRGPSEDRSTPSSNASGSGRSSSDASSVVIEGLEGGGGKKGKTPYFSFQLPEEPDFRARIYDKRLAAQAPGSPPALKHQLSKSGNEPAIAESFSMLDVEDFREERSKQHSRESTPASAPATRGRGGGRGGRGARADAGGRKGAKHKEESAAAAAAAAAAAPTRGGGRGTRGRPPKKEVQESAEEEEDEEDNDEEESEGSGEGEEGEDDEKDNDDDDEEEEEQSEQEVVPKTRGAATRGKGRGRGGRGRGRRGR